jgi:hypothetical protein
MLSHDSKKRAGFFPSFYWRWSTFLPVWPLRRRRWRRRLHARRICLEDWFLMWQPRLRQPSPAASVSTHCTAQGPSFFFFLILWFYSCTHIILIMRLIVLNDSIGGHIHIFRDVCFFLNPSFFCSLCPYSLKRQNTVIEVVSQF